MFPYIRSDSFFTRTDLVNLELEDDVSVVACLLRPLRLPSSTIRRRYVVHLDLSEAYRLLISRTNFVVIFLSWTRAVTDTEVGYNLLVRTDRQHVKFL